MELNFVMLDGTNSLLHINVTKKTITSEHKIRWQKYGPIAIKNIKLYDFSIIIIIKLFSRGHRTIKMLGRPKLPSTA